MMISITRKIEFCAAHRVMNHESKCKYFHGHQYILEASFTAKQLDSLGRIIDFSVIKSKLKSWIDQNLDHNAILNKDDKLLGKHIEEVCNQKIYYLASNPTAENIAHHILYDICPQLFNDTKVECIKVKLFETPNCWAEVIL